jgi:hypothetical protein
MIDRLMIDRLCLVCFFVAYLFLCVDKCFEA